MAICRICNNLDKNMTMIIGSKTITLSPKHIIYEIELNPDSTCLDFVQYAIRYAPHHLRNMLILHGIRRWCLETMNIEEDTLFSGDRTTIDNYYYALFTMYIENEELKSIVEIIEKRFTEYLNNYQKESA